MQRLLDQVRRAAARSPRELRERAMQELLAAGERGRLRVLGSAGAAGSPVPWVPGPFFAGVRDRDATVAALRDVAPGHAGRVLAAAERIDGGFAPVLGHGWLEIGRTPDWHREPVAGLHAPVRHWSRIPYLDPAVVGDHKVLWEFNRHQHFVTLGQAWAFTGDRRWADCLIRQVESWLAQNPPRVGVHWASSLEVAYRAISWCWALHLFADCDAVRIGLAPRMVASLGRHGAHVARYLSTWFSPNTHLTGEALGLEYIGATCPGTPRADSMRDMGARILETELPRQVHPDGVYFEQATQYHRYTTEIYLHHYLLCIAHGETPSRALRRALDGLFDVLVALLRPDGTMPLIGDDDGGRLVQLDGDPPHALRGLLAAGAVALDRADLAAAAGPPDDDSLVMACWLHGAAAVARLTSLRDGESSSTATAAFPHGGIFVVRDGDAGHAVMDAGPHGALSFGHSHADALAVDLFAAGGPLFVDAGTFTYVGAERDAFRGSAAHNTIEVDDQPICIPGAPFKWRTVAHAVADGWIATPEIAWVRGHHRAYERLADPVVHTRDLVRAAPGVWVVDDRLQADGAAAHTATLRWLLSPDVEVAGVEDWDGGTIFALRRRGRHIASLLVLAPSAACGVEDASVSGQFGRRDAARRIVCRVPFQRDLRLRSIVLDWTACPARETTLRMGDVSRSCASADGVDRQPAIRATLQLDVDAVVREPAHAFRAALVVTEGVAEADGHPRLVRVTAVGVQEAALGADAARQFREGEGWLVATPTDGGWDTRTGALPRVGL